MAAAATNRMAIAVCDRCGHERGVDWLAGTVLIGPDGWPLARPPAAEPALVLADMDLAAAREKALGPRNDALADRRPDLYAEVAGRP
jgi:predicted amidohydrolase